MMPANGRRRTSSWSWPRWRIALDIAQAPAGQVVYVDNTPMFVQIAEGLGIRGILHTDYRSTCAKLASLGLQNDEGGCYGTG